MRIFVFSITIQSLAIVDSKLSTYSSKFINDCHEEGWLLYATQSLLGEKDDLHADKLRGGYVLLFAETMRLGKLGKSIQIANEEVRDRTRLH